MRQRKLRSPCHWRGPHPAPSEPEYRTEPPSAPYVGPVTPEEWREAWAEAVLNDPDTREMLGLP